MEPSTLASRQHDSQPSETGPRSPGAFRLSPRSGFWLVGLALVVLLSASSAPSPLYVVYQQQWHFSASTLTIVFGSYAVALLGALLTVGGVSDFVGRRPVLVAALVLEAVSMVAFLSAGDVLGLVLARVLQGIATGAAMGAASAALVDLQPPDRPALAAVVNSAGATGGLAVGALGAGLLVQLAPAPTTLVFVILLVAFVFLAAALWLLPDTVSRRPGALASLRPHAAIPRPARRAFVTALPLMVATWAMGGLYLSLGPSLAVVDLGLTNHVVEALVVSAFTGAGALAAVVVRERRAHPTMIGGAAVLAAGTTLTLLGLHAGSVGVFFVGTVVAGAGFGAGFLGAFRTLLMLAEPHQRAELLASVFVASYLSFSIPAIAAGLLVPVLSLGTTAAGYGVIVITLALLVVLAEGSRVLRASRQRRGLGAPEA